MALFLLLALAAVQQPAPDPDKKASQATAETGDETPVESVGDANIVVTGARATRETVDERSDRYAETPFSDTDRVPLNSRIARKPDQRDFKTMATSQGLAGLIGSGLGANFDATGGQGLSRRTKKVEVCQASSKLVHEDIACGLTKAKAALEAGDFASARTGLDTLAAYGTLNDTERYFVETHRYMLGEASHDEALKYEALAAMIDSGAMPAAEQVDGYRALAAMALKRSDDAGAIRYLDRLAGLGGARDQDLASLAILLDRGQQRSAAKARMRQAIALRRNRGADVPAAWTAFVAD